MLFSEFKVRTLLLWPSCFYSTYRNKLIKNYFLHIPRHSFLDIQFDMFHDLTGMRNSRSDKNTRNPDVENKINILNMTVLRIINVCLLRLFNIHVLRVVCMCQLFLFWFGSLFPGPKTFFLFLVYTILSCDIFSIYCYCIFQITGTPILS